MRLEHQAIWAQPKTQSSHSTTHKGFAGVVVEVVVPSGGEVAFEGTFDGINFKSVTLRRVSNDGYVQTSTVDDTYIGSIAGMRQFRVRTSVAGGAAGTVMGTMQRYAHTLEGIENGPPEEFFFNIAQGIVDGKGYLVKFGRNPAITTGSTPEDVWSVGGLYTGQPDHSNAPEPVEVFSSSGNDNIFGTGATTVSISGLDENWEFVEEAIFMLGVTPNPSVTSWHRVNRVKVLGAGATGSNEGVITVRHVTTTANVFAGVGIGNNQSTILAFTVPIGQTGYIRNARIAMTRTNGSPGAADVSIRVKEPGGVYRAIRYQTLSDASPMVLREDGGLKLPEMSDVKVTVESISDNTTTVAGDFEVLFVEN